MRYLYLLTLLLISFSTISSGQPSRAAATQKTDSALILLKTKQKQTDDYVFKNQKSILVFSKVYKKRNLVKVINEDWPEGTEMIYNIVKDKQGKIILIAAMPYSESGDWYIEYKHYFDENGRVYAFTKKETSFDNSVKGGLVMEMAFRYYDIYSKLIGSAHRLTDQNDKLIKRKRAEFNFRDDTYSIYKDLNECIKAYNLKL
jgi:hypothetical protein